MSDRSQKRAVWQRDGMKPDERILILFKFGQKEHLDQFRKYGLMHMKTLRYFAEEEKVNTARNDRLEGAIAIYQPSAIRMTLNHPSVGTHEISALAGPTFFSRYSESKQNIFCMYSLTEPLTNQILTPKLLEFGEYFICIRNTPEFIQRVTQSLFSHKLEGRMGFVQYYDDTTYSGKITPFDKPDRFSYQKEFRFVVSPGTDPFLNLEIGNITDITSPVLPLSDIDQIVDFSQKTFKAEGWKRVDTP
jgi:hypothetical protein